MHSHWTQTFQMPPFVAGVAINAPAIALLLTSQLGANADANNTIVTEPWYRVDLTGTNAIANDVVQFRVDAVNDANATLSAANITAGYVDVQLDAQTRDSTATLSIDARIERGGSIFSAYSTAVDLTVHEFALDNLDNVYGAHGPMRLLSSHTGATIRLRRSNDDAERDFTPVIDGFVDIAQAVAWMRSDSAGFFGVRTQYDQSGNGRTLDQTSLTAGVQPGFGSNTTTSRGYLDFNGTNCLMSSTGLVGFSNNQAAISLAVSITWDAFTLDGGIGRAAMWVSNNSTLTRAGIVTNGTGIQALGRRLDADSAVGTAALTGSAGDWTVDVARFAHSEDTFYNDVFGTSNSLNPAKGTGSTSATDSASVNIGRQATLGHFDGRTLGYAWVRDKLSDAEKTALISAMDHSNVPAKPLIRAGVTLGVEAFRDAIIDEVFSGAGLPATGSDRQTLDTTDPLATYSLTPTNLDQVDLHEFDVYNSDASPPTLVGTVKCWIFRPTIGTSNNKFVAFSLGHTSDTTAFNLGNQGQLVKDLVEAGYTVGAHYMSAFEGTSANAVIFHNSLPEPTATYNPLRIFTEAPYRLLNEIAGEGFDFNFGCGLSGGGYLYCLMAAIDVRLKAVASHAGFLPLYMKNVDGTAGGTRDYEQYLPGLVELAATGGMDYPDLVVLGCAGGSNGARTFMHSINDADPSAFPGSKFANFLSHVSHTAAAGALYGGTYTFTIDTSSVHEYNATRRSAIVALFDTY